MSSSFSVRLSPAPLLQFKLLLLLCAALVALASPVTSPEIASKTGKLNQATVIVTNSHTNAIQQQQQQHQQHQQHQQQHQHQNQHQQSKLNSQDPHLNSLTVFATNYDSISSNNNNNNNNHNNNPSHSSNPQQLGNNFKPSFNYNNNNYNSINQNHKLPEPDFETNFTPIQSSALVNTPSEPLIMQYMPQTIQEGGVQYLQLIPTRPLIVPINSYLPSAPTAHVAADGVNGNPSLYHQPTPALTSNILTDYAPHAPAMLSSMPLNVAPPPPATLMEIPSSLPYGVQSYAQSLQPYRNYRINREINPKNLPPNLSLNMHEYLPSIHEASQVTYARGRP